MAVSNHEEGQTFRAAVDIPKARFVVLDNAGDITLAGNTDYPKQWAIGVAHLGAKANDHVPVLTYPGMRVVVETNESGVIEAGNILKSDPQGRAQVASSSDPEDLKLCVALGPEKVDTSDTNNFPNRSDGELGGQVYIAAMWR